MKPAAKVFRATLERIDSPLKWVMVRLPFNAGKVWGKRGQLKVKGVINGFAFRTSLFSDGIGGHRLLVNKQMQRGAKTAPGMSAQFHIEPDAEVREVILPRELTRAMSGDRALRRWFDGLSPSARNDICKTISQPKSPEARVRRAEQMAERLLAAKEAEHELPPVLLLAFENNFLARKGWQLMPPKKKRGHLLGIFYYQSPESRARRIEKMMEEAVLLAERGKTKS